MNIFPRGVLFFPMPEEIMAAGIVGQMSGSALKLYLFLLYLAQKHSAVRIETVAYEVRDYVGLHENSVSKARVELVELGLVKCRAIEHNVFEYQLLHPATKQPLEPPTDKKDGKPRKGLRRWRPVPGRSARTSKQVRSKKASQKATEFDPLSWDQIEGQEIQ
jgi:hypothetical protein